MGTSRNGMPVAKMKTTVLNGQSLFDLAVQGMGDISGVFDLAEMAGMQITDELTTGQLIELPPAVDRQVAGYYASHGIIPATAITIDSTADDGGLLLEGIEFWGIEYDFMVN